MNSKKKNFLISQSIVVLFVLLFTLVANYFLMEKFEFTQEIFFLITFILLFLGLGLYLLLSKPLLEPLFKSDENLQKAVKETLHELNIPVSTIDLNAKMLEKDLSDEKSLKRLRRIKKAADNLIKLYDEMEYSIKKEIDKVELQHFSLQKCLEESLQKFEDIKQDISIEVSLSDFILNTDKNGFVKVLDNLISNAIKYNEKEGCVKISCDNSVLSFYNSGKSIDTKNLFMVFDKYYQEDSANDGFGLGLNIVKAFCDKHGIAIKIEPINGGTTIHLDLKKIVVS